MPRRDPTEPAALQDLVRNLDARPASQRTSMPAPRFEQTGAPLEVHRLPRPQQRHPKTPRDAARATAARVLDEYRRSGHLPAMVQREIEARLRAAGMTLTKPNGQLVRYDEAERATVEALTRLLESADQRERHEGIRAAPGT